MADEERREPVVDTGPDVNQEKQPEQESDEVRELRQQLEEAKAKAEENWSQFLRARAELENMRRRADRDVEHARRYALEKFAGELLAVKDSLEMGAEAARDENTDVAKLREGTELTLRMLEQAMDKFEIKSLNPHGEKFDPEKHEAMAAQESDKHDPNTVMHVVQKGYLLGDRLLRPAMVVVSKPESKPQDGGIDEQA